LKTRIRERWRNKKKGTLSPLHKKRPEPKFKLDGLEKGCTFKMDGKGVGESKRLQLCIHH